ncbi:MAG: hypothetical protein IKU16_01035, partial [Muribaculaceae bacterium]|nr:hypothetical protein [Muribaculaceae bacterium]
TFEGCSKKPHISAERLTEALVGNELKIPGFSRYLGFRLLSFSQFLVFRTLRLGRSKKANLTRGRNIAKQLREKGFVKSEKLIIFAR